MFQGEADEGTRSAKRPAWERPFTFCGVAVGEGVPERSSVQAAWLSRSFFSSSLSIGSVRRCRVRPAVKDLEGVDLGLVLLDVVAERLDEALGFRPFAAASKPWLSTVSMVTIVDGLLGLAA